MKAALLIAVVLTSVVLVEPWCVYAPKWCQKGSKKGVQALQDTRAKLEELLHGAESDSALNLMELLERSGGDLDGDAFEKKVASLQETAAELEEKVEEVEEDAALGLLEEELEELEEVKNGPEE
ncbi:Hypp2375 [Branchiostoma lanceolatum]|uniref:Hypp2375 protein n=1 Tax=Branchiostoma lanceolatum TaxID=7740 RepID=A0A8J9ZQ56_BRALA|nr:Hypp2375 [Branchiostoma lanceolatum]